MNRFILSGRCAKNVDFKISKDGLPSARFCIVTSRSFKKSAKSNNKTSIFPIIAFRKLAENINNNLRIGRYVNVEGHLDSYLDKNINRRIISLVCDIIEYTDPKYKPSFNGKVPASDIIRVKNFDDAEKDDISEDDLLFSDDYSGTELLSEAIGYDSNDLPF